MISLANLIAGFLFGIFVTNIYFKTLSPGGFLRIDHSNSEKDVYRIELNDPICEKKTKYFFLKVDHKADLSQK